MTISVLKLFLGIALTEDKIFRFNTSKISRDKAYSLVECMV